MARIIGLDLGSWSVKATIMEGGFSRFDVVERRIQEVPQDGSALPTRAARIAAARELLDDLVIDDNTSVGIAYPIDMASMRWVAMPFTDKNQIAQTLSFEVEGLVPFNLDDMLVEHRIIGTSGEGSAVLAAMIPKDGLRTHIDALADAGLDPKSLVVDGDLLSTHGGAGVEAILDMGHSRTLVTVAKDGETIFSRAVSIGGWHLTQAIAEAHETDWETAEAMKHGARLSTKTVAEWDDEEVTQSTEPGPHLPHGDATTNALRDALAPLVASLRTTLIGFEDTTGLEVDRIRLTGGTSELDGIINLLKVEMGVSVATIPVETSDLRHPYAHALSQPLAQRAAGIGAAGGLELRTGDFRFRGNMANLRVIAAACVAVCFLGIFGSVGWFAYKYKGANAQLAILDAQLAEAVAAASSDPDMPLTFESPDDALTALQLQTLEASARIDLLGPIVASTPPTVTALNHISTSLPDPKEARIDVNELTMTPQSINIKAITDGYDAAANIESALASNVRFKGARKGNEKKSALGISFTVTIPLEDDQTEEDG
jgi:Tfp pilus assembly PilM family ATPase